MGTTSQDYAGDFVLALGSVTTDHSIHNRMGQSVIPEGPVTLFKADDAWRGYPMRQWERDHWKFWLLGEIYSGDSALHDLPLDQSQAVRLNGHFILFAEDTTRKEWHVWTDRLGTVHAYQARRENITAIGTSFSAVCDLASNKKLDWVGLAGLCSFGFFPQDRTHYDDVRILKPASHYHYDQKGNLLKQGRYWQWSYEPNKSRSYDNTVKEFADIFKQVISDHTREGKIAVPISGGLDSRSTIAALDSKDLQSRLWVYTYGYDENSVEIKIAQQIARARKIPIHTFVIKPYLFQNIDEVINSTEGFQDITQCRQAAISEELGKHSDHVLAAHWGDVWLDNTLETRSKVDGLQAAAQDLSHEKIADLILKKFQKQGREWLLENVCQPHLGNIDIDKTLRDLIASELKEYDHIHDFDFRLKAFKTDHWSFRWTVASFRMFQRSTFPKLPFYDNRLIDFFCTVPTTYVKGRKLQIDYIKQYAPNLAQITWQAFDANLHNYKHFNIFILLKKIVKKIARLLNPKKAYQRNWETQFLNIEGRKGLEKRLLDRGLKLHKLLDLHTVQKLLNSLYTKPNSANGYSVSMLLTLSSWLEKKSS